MRAQRCQPFPAPMGHRSVPYGIADRRKLSVSSRLGVLAAGPGCLLQSLQGGCARGATSTFAGRQADFHSWIGRNRKLDLVRRKAGLRSLRWLMARQTAASGVFRPVGTQSFGDKRKAPRMFDQQPLEAAATI